MSENQPVLISLENEIEKPVLISFQEMFGNAHPVEIEMGCGKGRFLVEMAQKYPDTNYWGVDRILRWMKVGKIRSEKRNLPNLRFSKADIREVCRNLSEESVSVFHIYFPDPWPKRRHRRRRLVNATLLQSMLRALKPQGRIEIATDDADYYAAIKKTVSGPEFLWSSMKESVNQRFGTEGFKTNYESKFESAGRKIYYLELIK